MHQFSWDKEIVYFELVSVRFIDFVLWRGDTVCSNGFYADISNQNQVQQYKSCYFYKILIVLKYHRCLWANIFDTDINRCINTYIKVVYLAFLGTFMLLQMSVSKILAHRLKIKEFPNKIKEFSLIGMPHKIKEK